MARPRKEVEKHKPTAADWDKIRIYFLRGESMDFIMDKVPDVDVKPDTIMNKMQKEGMIKKRREINNTVIDKLNDELVEEKEKSSRACIKAYKKGLDLINELLASYRMEMDSPGRSGKAKCTAYNMDMLMSGITKIQKGFDVAFGVDAKTGKLTEQQPELLVIEGVNMDKI